MPRVLSAMLISRLSPGSWWRNMPRALRPSPPPGRRGPVLRAHPTGGAVSGGDGRPQVMPCLHPVRHDVGQDRDPGSGLAMVFSVLGMGACPYLIDYVAKALRPVSVCTRIARAVFQVIDAIYPNLVAGCRRTTGLGREHPKMQAGGARPGLRNSPDHSPAFVYSATPSRTFLVVSSEVSLLLFRKSLPQFPFQGTICKVQQRNQQR